MTRWIYLPRSQALPPHLAPVIAAFGEIETQLQDHYHAWDKWAEVGGGQGPRLPSNEVLAMVRPGLEAAGFSVEYAKTPTARGVKLSVTVLWGEQGKPAKQYESDATLEHEPGRLTVVEVEAGGGTANNLWRKDLMEASIMPNVDYLVIAVREAYKHRSKSGRVNTNPDFDTVRNELDAVYASHRLKLPLKGILLVGY